MTRIRDLLNWCVPMVRYQACTMPLVAQLPFLILSGLPLRASSCCYELFLCSPDAAGCCYELFLCSPDAAGVTCCAASSSINLRQSSIHRWPYSWFDPCCPNHFEHVWPVYRPVCLPHAHHDFDPVLLLWLASSVFRVPQMHWTVALASAFHLLFG